MGMYLVGERIPVEIEVEVRMIAHQKGQLKNM